MREQVPEPNDDDTAVYTASSSTTMPVRTLRANSNSMSLSVIAPPALTFGHSCCRLFALFSRRERGLLVRLSPDHPSSALTACMPQDMPSKTQGVLLR